MANFYVDEIRQHETGYWCHLWTDGTTDELIAFGQRLGLRAGWLHYSKGLSGDFTHFDLRMSKRDKALKAGATYMRLVDWIKTMREGE